MADEVRARLVGPQQRVDALMPGDDRDYLYGMDAERGPVRITRSVQMKANPSRHECDSRCMNANGRTMNCECACGGRNHGKGRFACEAA